MNNARGLILLSVGSRNEGTATAVEETIADYAHILERRGEEFRLKDFFDKLNKIDSIPISLGRWELTGRSDQVVH